MPSHRLRSKFPDQTRKLPIFRVLPVHPGFCWQVHQGQMLKLLQLIPAEEEGLQGTADYLAEIGLRCEVWRDAGFLE